MKVEAVLRRGKSWARRVGYAYELAAPRRYLFVMSHMRSYSSLLSHILNSNPDIDGYVEMHKPYTKPLDLLELTLRVRHTTGTRLRGRYVVDKVLHNYEMSPQVLRRKDVYTVFSVRDPDQAIRSIIAMGLRRKNLDWKSDPDKVVKHYVNRLARLEKNAKQKREQSLFFDAQALIDHTDDVLSSLTGFLELKTPLVPSYQTSEFTGKRRFGDNSPFITSGEIVTKRDDYSTIDIPDHLMSAARLAYDDCRATLEANCAITVGPRSGPAPTDRHEAAR